jgi:hypothetical protein
MRRYVAAKIILTTLLIGASLATVCLTGAQAAGDSSPDAISVRVMANLENLSPLAWYTRNIEVQGSPQELTVDGYQAVRDGRTVYVNAANVDGNSFYTNIFIISYNQDAEKATQDIFAEIIKHWSFNTNVPELGTCQPLSKDECWNDADCTAPEYCDSQKAKTVRDVRRVSDLYEVHLALQQYYASRKTFPVLPNAIYMSDRTVSTWSSWNDTFGKTLGYDLPIDPINVLGKCKTDDAENAKYDPISCWDEKNQLFATDFANPVLPVGSLAYAYVYDTKQIRYKLCTNFETNYVNLPANDQCDNFVQQISTTPPEIIFGKLDGGAGKYEGYVTVKSFYAIDWDKTQIDPVSPSSWSNWGGWVWNDLNDPGLKIKSTTSENQKKITASSVNLSQPYATFKFRMTVEDKFGNQAQKDGTITICNELTCNDSGIKRCGAVQKRCIAGYLQCGDCAAGQTCVNSVCQ